VLYAHGQGAISLEDVDAVVSDVSALAMDAVVDAAFAGDLAQLEAGYRRLTREGVAPAAVLAGALRHALALLAQRVDIEDTGRSITSAVEGWRGLHFRRRSAIERQLRAWTGETLRRRIGTLQAELLDSRRVAALGDAIAARGARPGRPGGGALSPALSLQAPAQASSCRGAVADAQLAPLPLVVDGDLEAEDILESLLDGAGVRSLSARRGRVWRARRAVVLVGDALHLADVEALVDDALRGRLRVLDASSARAWPALMAASVTMVWIEAGSCSSRRVLATWLRLRPRICARSAWLLRGTRP
jgi:hypothetical protein